MEITGKVKVLKNKNIDSAGVAVAPLAHELEYGQIAINYNALNPAMFFKTYDDATKQDKVVKIVTEEVIADTLVDILGGSASDLSTLKELLDAFASSDIATTQADILTRLSSVESGKVDKVAGKGLSTNDYTNADKAHMTNTSNPHNTTKAQIGLGNVVNKEQLGKDEAAVEANKLSRVFLNDVSVDDYFNNTIYVLGSNVAGTPLTTSTQGSKMFAIRWDDNAGSQMFFEHATDDVHIRRKSSTWQPWRRLYHSGNANRLTVNWAADTMNANRFIGTDLALSGNAVIQNNQVYHAGNCNNATTDWTTRILTTRTIKGKVTAANANGDWLDIMGSNGNGTDKQGGGLAIYSGKGTGTGVGGDIQFISSIAGTSGSTVNPSVVNMVIKYDGKVGIGTPTPATDLHLVNKTTNCIFRLESKSGTHSLFSNNSNGSLNIWNHSNTEIIFATNDLPKMVISKDGNVGINNPNPTAKLDVNGNTKTSGKFIGSTVSTLNGNIFSIDSEKRTTTTILQLINAEWAAGIASVSGALQVRVGGVTDDKVVVNFGSGIADFKTGAQFNGNVTAKGDVSAYSSTNNVFIEPSGMAGASNLFDLNDVELPTNLTNNYVLAYDATKKKWTAKESLGTGGSNIDYTKLSNVPTTFTPCAHNHEDATYVSDSRLKQNIEPISNALNTILSLNSKSFSWTTEAKNRYNMKDDISYGYIAQDVQKIIPDIVKELETGDGYIGVEYIKVIPFITEAIRDLHLNNVDTNQELKRSIKELKKSIATYKLANDKLANDNAIILSELTAIKQKLSI